MKKLILLTLFTVFALGMPAQAPQGFTHQAVIRNAANELVINQSIGIKVSIIKETPDGTVMYSETQTPSSNSNGLITFIIGEGNVLQGVFANIDWTDGPYFIKIEADPGGGSNYTISGTTRLMSVPYALHAQSAENLAGIGDGYVAGPGIEISGNEISANLALRASLTGDTLVLDPGNHVFIPGLSNANAELPVVNTGNVSNITAHMAYGHGEIIYYGQDEILESGVCWSINLNPTIIDAHESAGPLTGHIIVVMEGLAENTLYFARAYAQTTNATFYGQNVLFFTTDILPVPTVSTTEVSGITETTALSGGFVSADGGSPVTARGVCWHTSPAPTISNSKTVNGSGTGLYTSYLTSLTLNTNYYVRAYATNDNGTNYGPELTFKTAGVLPTVITLVPHSITTNRAVLCGEVTSQGSAPVTQRGICYGTSPNPSISGSKVVVGSGLGSFCTADAIFLPNTTYYVRAFATSSVGTAYGANHQFTTLNAYYEGFESNAPGWATGAWGIVSSKSYEGYFSLYTKQGNAEATFTREFPNGGEMAFYLQTFYSGSYPPGGGSVAFYINNNLQATIQTSNNWLNHNYSVTPGIHTFKWKYNTGNQNGAWLDYIIMVDY
jgi:hypothetical protein